MFEKTMFLMLHKLFQALSNNQWENISLYVGTGGCNCKRKGTSFKEAIKFSYNSTCINYTFLLPEMFLVFANKFHVKRGQLSSLKPKKTISAHIPEKINSAKCPAETCNNKVAIEAQKCLTVYIPQSLMFGS